MQVYIGDGVRVVYKMYDGWSITIDEIIDIFDFLLQDRTITANNIYLEYKDTFIETDNEEDALCLEDIFEKDNGYTSKKAMESATPPWKSTFSAFAGNNSDDKSVRFDEITMEYLCKHMNKKDCVSCTARHIYIFYERMVMDFTKSEEGAQIAMLKEMFFNLHNEHKNILDTIFTKHASKRVGLIGV
jgi:hypothetical protein